MLRKGRVEKALIFAGGSMGLNYLTGKVFSSTFLLFFDNVAFTHRYKQTNRETVLYLRNPSMGINLIMYVNVQTNPLKKFRAAFLKAGIFYVTQLFL